MIIKEENIKPSLLDSIPYIDEQPISEAIIPITENTRLGKYIVSIEDIDSFCEDNCEDPGYVISRICKSNGISPDNIAFSIKEESVILGESAASISNQLAKNGNFVYAIYPVHDKLWKSIGYELCEEFKIPIQEVTIGWVDKKLGRYYQNSAYNDDRASNEYITRAVRRSYYNKLHDKGKITDDEWEDSYKHKDENEKEQQRIEGLRLRFAHKGHVGRERNHIRELDRKRAERNAQDQQQSSSPDTSAINSEINKAKSSNDKNFIAKVIARLHDWAKKYRDKYKNGDSKSGIKPAFQKAIYYITNAITALTRRLHNLTTKKENAIQD